MSTFQEKTVPIQDTALEFSYDSSQKSLESISRDDSAELISESAPMAASESRELPLHDLNVAEAVVESETVPFDLFLPLIVITSIFAGLTIYYLIKSKKSN